MRAFTAVTVPVHVRDALEATVSSVRDRYPDLAWTPAHRWHVTLAFLADLPDDRVDELMDRLRRAASRTEPFELRVDGFGRFGQRIVYAHLAGERARLRRLAERCAAAATRCGVEVPEGRYRPHVTLARARRPTDLRPVAEALGSLETRWTVDHLVLVRSTLGAQPTHDVLAEIPFA